MQRCLFCSGDADEPEHWKHCDGRQGRIEAAIAARRPPIEFRSAYNLWPRPWTRDNPAFIGLREETINVICDDTINDAMVKALWRVLDDGDPHYGHDVIRQLETEAWFPEGLSRSSKERFVRKIFDTGVARGYPLCSGNYGYAIGDADMLDAAAKRERALERGAGNKAEAFERVAVAIRKRSG